MQKDIIDLKRFVAQWGGKETVPADDMGALDSAIILDERSASPGHRMHPSESLPIAAYEDKNTFVNAEIIPDTLSLQEKEKEMICKALHKNNGRRKDTAADLGISERTLYRKLKEYQIDTK